MCLLGILMAFVVGIAIPFFVGLALPLVMAWREERKQKRA